jgi:hypothetical protein
MSAKKRALKRPDAPDARESAEAEACRLEAAWADAQKIANGDRRVGSWDTIKRAAEKARRRIVGRAKRRTR